MNVLRITTFFSSLSDGWEKVPQIRIELRDTEPRIQIHLREGGAWIVGRMEKQETVKRDRGGRNGGNKKKETNDKGRG